MNVLTLEFLKTHNACQSGIDFCINNKLIGFPLDKINEIKGDYRNYISWIKKILSDTYEYDQNNNLIYKKDSNNCEYWYEYDSNNNLIHYKDNTGYEDWKEYDSNNNLIHYKNNTGNEYWKEYDSNNNLIYKKDNNGEETNIITYYPNGQLKTYNTLKIPYFNKS